jgi:hypothetical protein
MADVDSTAVSGVEVRGFRRGTLSTDSWDQYVIPVRDRITSYKGRAFTFVTPGRAAAAQKILALHNATSSPVLINVNRIRIDVIQSVAKAITVISPTVRVHRFTTLPTGGTALTKTPMDSSMTSSSSVTVWGDSSADNTGAGTSSGTTLTITPGNILGQTWGPRMISAAGYEMVDNIEFFVGEPDVTLRALEGLVVVLDNANTAVLGNPATDRWLAGIDWEEYTRP